LFEVLLGTSANKSASASSGDGIYFETSQGRSLAVCKETVYARSAYAEIKLRMTETVSAVGWGRQLLWRGDFIELKEICDQLRKSLFRA
jgi:hypothetical protein